MPLLRAAFLSDEEHRNLLTQAGFTDVTTKHLRGKNWILAMGRRAGSSMETARPSTPQRFSSQLLRSISCYRFNVAQPS